MEFFDYYEFDCQCKGCLVKGEAMDSDFLRQLDLARKVAGVSFNINSGMRCDSHNTEVGGSETSSHLTGHAADIATPDSRARFAIMDGLRQAGFERIGVAKTFIHVDNDPKKTGAVCWVYA
jgi:zinc D-Ala-D-Ala carboxypeptidase